MALNRKEWNTCTWCEKEFCRISNEAVEAGIEVDDGLPLREFGEVIEETGDFISQVPLFRYIGPKGGEEEVYKSGKIPWTVKRERAFREIKRLVVGAVDLYVMDAPGAKTGINPLYLLPDACKYAAGLGLGGLRLSEWYCV